MATPESLFISSDIADIVDMETVTTASQFRPEQPSIDIIRKITSAWIEDDGNVVVTIKGSVQEYLPALLDRTIYQTSIHDQKYQCKVIKLEQDSVYLQLEVDYAGI